VTAMTGQKTKIRACITRIISNIKKNLKRATTKLNQSLQTRMSLGVQEDTTIFLSLAPVL